MDSIAMPLLPPSFDAICPQLKRMRTAPGKPNIGPELGALVQGLLDIWPFDEAWYLGAYPDVAEAIRSGKLKSARHHYLNFGFFESRLPCAPEVDDVWYLRRYPDVAKGIEKGRFKNATQHYIEFGYREGRMPSEIADRQ